MDDELAAGGCTPNVAAVEVNSGCPVGRVACGRVGATAGAGGAVICARSGDDSAASMWRSYVAEVSAGRPAVRDGGGIGVACGGAVAGLDLGTVHMGLVAGGLGGSSGPSSGSGELEGTRYDPRMCRRGVEVIAQWSKLSSVGGVRGSRRGCWVGTQCPL